MFLLHHCKQFFTRIKKYNKEILALDAKDVISTFFFKKIKKKKRKKERKKHFKTGLAYKLCTRQEPQVYSFNKIFNLN